MRYRTTDTWESFTAAYTATCARCAPATLDLAPNGLKAEQVAQPRSLNSITGRSASRMPEHSLLVVHNGKGLSASCPYATAPTATWPACSTKTPGDRLMKTP